jgi:FtsZ-binding cell division protein ZapB
VGFSAQNVKSVLPEASALQDSGYWSLDDTAISALMVNAIKGQQIQIAALSERVFSLSKVVQVDRSTLQALRIENDQVKERLKKLMAIVCGERADDPACQ